MSSFAHIHVAARTDVGRKRKRNEDAFGVFPDAGIFCIADGMGGSDDGELASAVTIWAVERMIAGLMPANDAALAFERVTAAVVNAVNRASCWLCKRVQKNHLKGCGSTFVGVCFDATNPSSALALHAGDSRLYRIRNRVIRQITVDHSVASMIGVRNEEEITPMFRHCILRAVGVAREVKLERTPVDVRAGDRFILCSDGLSRMLSDGRLLRLCLACASAEVAADALVSAANVAGGLDNITIVVLDIGTLPAPLPVADDVQGNHETVNVSEGDSK